MYVCVYMYTHIHIYKCVCVCVFMLKIIVMVLPLAGYSVGWDRSARQSATWTNLMSMVFCILGISSFSLHVFLPLVLHLYILWYFVSYILVNHQSSGILIWYVYNIFPLYSSSRKYFDLALARLNPPYKVGILLYIVLSKGL